MFCFENILIISSGVFGAWGMTFWWILYKFRSMHPNSTSNTASWCLNKIDKVINPFLKILWNSIKVQIKPLALNILPQHILRPRAKKAHNFWSHKHTQWANAKQNNMYHFPSRPYTYVVMPTRKYSLCLLDIKTFFVLEFDSNVNVILSQWMCMWPAYAKQCGHCLEDLSGFDETDNIFIYLVGN